LFTLDELIEKFSIDRVSKAGAKFDFEKAKWFNAEWIKKSEVKSEAGSRKGVLSDKGIAVTMMQVSGKVDQSYKRPVRCAA
jgi:glutamyl-tRNA synthetase